MVRLRPRYIKDYFWQSKARSVVRWIIEIAITVALAFGVSYYFGQKVVVTDSSMETTLKNGDEALIDVLAYTFGTPQRGDVIAYKTGDDNNAAVRVMRVIGLPGETVRITDGQIYIDDVLYKEEKDFPSISNAGLAADGITLGGTEYFLLGDNRNNSEDSRYVDIGNIEKNLIKGKLWLKISPLSEIGFIN